MKVALIGYAQAGKKTMFALLSGRPLPIARREGEAPEGVSGIYDPRVDALTKICKPERTKYAENAIVLCPDIPSEPGGHEWLDAARRCDLLCCVVRGFTSAEVYHPAGSVDMARDRANIEAELILADLELVEKRLERLGKEKRNGLSPAQMVEEKALVRCKEILESSKWLNIAGLETHELAAIKSLGFVTLLPVLWACNVDEAELTVQRERKTNVFFVSARIEQEIMTFDDPAERREYLKGIGQECTGLERMNQAAYDTMGLMSFYTIGPDEVRAWTIRKGTCAPAAGGKVHSDIERGFIRVEIIKFDDLVAAGSEEQAHKLGKVAVKGKDYVIEDGDICHFRFNV